MITAILFLHTIAIVVLFFLLIAKLDELDEVERDDTENFY